MLCRTLVRALQRVQLILRVRATFNILTVFFISLQRSVEPLVRASKLTSESDTLVLEDEGARVRLSGEKLDHKNLVTGAILNHQI